MKQGSWVAVALALVAAGCHPPPPAAPPLTHTGPFGPGRDTIHMTTAERASFNTYVAGLSFDTAQGIADMQKLSDSATLINTGPLAKISPRVGIHWQDSLSITNGAVLTLIETNDTVSYLKMGMRGAGSYYWVIQNDSSFVVPADTTRPVTYIGAFQLNRHPGHAKWRNDWANWRWSTTDEMGWTTCSKTGCCTTNGP